MPAICGLLALAVIVVFGQTSSYKFINFDDPAYVSDNQQVRRGLTSEGIAWAFTSTHAGFWHPLTTMSHMLDVELYGLARPGRHHLTSVLIHASTAIVLFLALRRLTRELWPSALTAALFAIHPLRVESVAWVAERKDVLSGFFFALTLLLYAGYARRPTVLRYVPVALSLCSGLMCKPMPVTLPFVLLLLDYWPLGRLCSSNGRSFAWLFLEKAPLMVLAAAAAAATVWAQDAAIQSLATISSLARVTNAAVSYVAYLRQMVWPSGLAVLYPHPQDGLPLWQALAACGLLAAISAIAFFLRRHRPYLLVGWLWYLGMLVPVIGLVQSGEQARADRFTYLPQIGLAIAIVWWAVHTSSDDSHERAESEKGVRTHLSRRTALGVDLPFREKWVLTRVLTPFSLLVVVLLAFAAERQTKYWCNSETLWAHTLDCTSQNAIAHYQLGEALGGGRVDEAIAQYRLALAIWPDYPPAHNNLGFALASRRQVDEAIEHYRKALATQPRYVAAHNNLGMALMPYRGHVDEAIDHFRRALEIEPGNAMVHNNLGNALAGCRQVDEAINHFRKALEIEPGNAAVHNNLGHALAARGQTDEAFDEFRKALEIQPVFAEAHYNLANALIGCGKLEEAREHYQKALYLANADNNAALAEDIRARIGRAGRGD